MSFLGGIAKILFPALGLLGVFGHKSKPIQPLPPPIKDQAQAVADRQDELARRRGAAADMLTGTQGAEASAGSIGRVVASN